MANNNKETVPGFRIEDGFVIGTNWHTGKTVMVAVHAIERISLDCGNSPPADRIHFLNERIPYVDLRRVYLDEELEAANRELEIA